MIEIDFDPRDSATQRGDYVELRLVLSREQVEAIMQEYDMTAHAPVPVRVVLHRKRLEKELPNGR